MTLLELMDAPPVRDSHVSEPGEQQRLRGQNQRILALLQCGPQSNRRLAEVSLKYTSRISDLRKAGYVIRCERYPDGVAFYLLEQA